MTSPIRSLVQNYISQNNVMVRINRSSNNEIKFKFLYLDVC
jgi:hypothetical protein